jgi:plasmid stability protein
VYSASNLAPPAAPPAGQLVQIRDVPEEVHRTLKARAAISGVSLSEYVRGVLARSTTRPTPVELSARIEARGAVELDTPSEISVRSIRDRGE